MKLSFLLAITLLVFTVTATVMVASNKVSFYTAFPGHGQDALKWLQDASTLAGVPQPKLAATGFYYCCNVISIDAAGQVHFSRSDEQMQAAIAPVKAAGLTVHIVAGISMDSVLNETWRNTTALATIKAKAVKNNFDGIIVDYEPSKDYTKEHAVKYNNFLTALSQAMHSGTVRKESGFDCAGWGILDNWQIYQKSGVDIATSMTPTYNWQGNGSKLYEFVEREIAPGAGMPLASVAIGIGTTLTPSYKPEWNYNWTRGTLMQFSDWLRHKAGVPRMDFWRADIDHNYPAKATEQFVFEAAAMFLGVL